MTKRQLIDEIIGINQTAEPQFLARFNDDELTQYLDHLRSAELPRLSGDPCRFDRYFENCPVAGTRPTLWRTRGAAAAEEGAADPADAEEGGPDGGAQQTEVPLYASPDAEQAGPDGEPEPANVVAASVPEGSNAQPVAAEQEESESWLY